MKILIITGPPYSGKGTQCEILEKTLGYKHISTGEIIRDEKEKGSKLGITMKDYEEKGMLVPDKIMKVLLNQIIAKHEAAKGIILDGYPRTIPQVDTLLEILEEKQKSVHQVINIAVSKEELLDRAKARAKSSDRVDDKDASIHLKRIALFEENSKPAIQYLKEKMEVVDIDGMGSINNIASRIHQQLI